MWSQTNCQLRFAQVAIDLVNVVKGCGIAKFGLSLDISFNEDATGRAEPHWCVHAHVLILDWLTQAQDRALRAAFPNSARIARPVKVSILDGKKTVRLYIFKPDRVRRVTSLDSSNPKRAAYRGSKRRDLRPSQAVMLAHVEHELGFEYRLIARGLEERAVRAALGPFYRVRDGP